jgi:hypothetical protein
MNERRQACRIAEVPDRPSTSGSEAAQRRSCRGARSRARCTALAATVAAALAFSQGALASPQTDVNVVLGAKCGSTFRFWQVVNRNKAQNVSATVQVTVHAGGKTVVVQRLIPVPPGGSTTVACSGSVGGPSGGAYKEDVKLLSAAYK